MDYAVVLYFDNETDNIIRQYMSLAADVSGNRYMMDNHIPPHITVAAFSVDDVVPVLSEMLGLEGKIAQGGIVLESVGSFSPNVIYLQPSLDSYLMMAAIEVRQALSRIVALDPLYTPPRWFPHVSLAVKLTQAEHNEALAAVRERFEPISGGVVRLGIMKCNPFRPMANWALRG